MLEYGLTFLTLFQRMRIGIIESIVFHAVYFSIAVDEVSTLSGQNVGEKLTQLYFYRPSKFETERRAWCSIVADR